MTIQQNVAQVQKLKAIVQSHLVGGCFSETKDYVQVVFHDDSYSVQGVRVSKSGGLKNALTLMIEKLDEIYNDAFGWSSHHTPLKSINQGVTK